ncbi:hypothetical protein TD95_005365 [Thielaviopsis punctulata]|uniref:GDP/GTP exchange factor Sec2 N-terminal domain-containing protein n=1 Tax=Thielaviopsis punctulata TaxID=72032 RepID=A0A0F4Z9E1_9PEZI|nr:hypothetical protein TD95_005365 [Thielaviopsis punctulata]
MALAASPVILPLPVPPSATSCSNCGAHLDHHIDIAAVSDAQVALLEAQRRIAELENRVRSLQKQLDSARPSTPLASPAMPPSPSPSPASAKPSRHHHSNSTISISSSASSSSAGNYTHRPPSMDSIQSIPCTPSPPPSRATSSSWSFSAGRITSLLTRKSAAASALPPPASPFSSPASTDKHVGQLMAALDREQALRAEAEGKLSATSREVEELSVELFERANEMVATERRENARLKERVAMLERRDVEKKARLECLEGSMKQIQRVRALLAEEPQPALVVPKVRAQSS